MPWPTILRVRPNKSDEPLTEAERAIENAKAALRKSQKEVEAYLNDANKNKSSGRAGPKKIDTIPHARGCVSGLLV